MTKLVIILASLLVVSSFAALQAQGNADLQEYKDEAAALELDTMGASKKCKYTLKISTAIRWGAGTESRLLFRFYNYKDPAIVEVVKRNIYTGSLNTIEFEDDCRDRLCFLRINSDGKGYDPDWKPEWISITIEGEGRKTFTHKFNINKWIGPKTKTYMDIDDCASVQAAEENQNLSSFSII